MSKERPEHVKCENCVFWQMNDEDGNEFGDCRRFPPGNNDQHRVLTELRLLQTVFCSQLKPDGDDRINERFSVDCEFRDYNIFSNTSRDAWCGEFRSEWPQ